MTVAQKPPRKRAPGVKVNADTIPALTAILDAKHGKPKRVAGAAPVYRPEMAEIAHNLCLMGATNEKMANIFGVSETTITHWMKRNQEFRDAVHRGKDQADAEIAKSLFGRAKGHSHIATKVLIIDGKPHQEHYIENHPPDTNAAKFWLINRQRDNWAERTEVDNTHTIKLTEEQINERLLKLMPPE